MKNKNYSVLLIGNFESVYVVQLVKNLKLINPNAHIFFWGYTREKMEADRSFIKCYDECCFFDMKKFIKSSLLWQISAIRELRKSFRNFVAGKHFDYISIQYIKPEYFFLLYYFKKCASHLVLTPWGSDVYRIGWLSKLFVKCIFNNAYITTGANDRFTEDYIKIFNVPKNKLRFCNLGIETIDYIVNHKEKIDINEAKHQLGIENNYIITCGYNATPGQQHLEIIDAINNIKKNLPPNLLLLFPLTYPNNPDYIKEIKLRVNNYGLKAIYFEDFLDISRLFLLRQATDIFVHMQISDASCASLREYLLCDKKVVNGGWLHYPELIINGNTPFFEVDSLENLGQAIVNAYVSKPIQLEDELITFLKQKQWKVRIKDWDNLFQNNMD